MQQQQQSETLTVADAAASSSEQLDLPLAHQAEQRNMAPYELFSKSKMAINRLNSLIESLRAASPQMASLAQLLTDYREYLESEEYQLDMAAAGSLSENNNNNNNQQANIKFCVNECPPQAPHATLDLYCTGERQRITSAM